MSPKKIFLALGLFWIVIIGAFVGYKEYTLRTGEEVLLQTVPVDPRDLFRGDYVVLRYEISSLYKDAVIVERDDFALGERVYVTLAPSGEQMVATGVYATRPSEGLFIQGTLQSVSGNMLRVEYGIESYFVPEGRGREIERQWGSDVDAKVSIDRYGNAVIKTLLIDGQEVIFK